MTKYFISGGRILIIGNKVILRALRRSDFGKILEWVNDPEIRYLTGTIYPISEIEHEKWIENKINEKTDKMFAIDDLKNKKFIGLIGSKNTDFVNRNTELYIYIGDKEYWGKGYGTDAIATFVKFCFDELNLHRVYLYVFAYNERAIRAYEKVGFVTEGILKESVYKNGKYHDKLLMAIVKK